MKITFFLPFFFYSSLPENTITIALIYYGYLGCRVYNWSVPPRMTSFELHIVRRSRVPPRAMSLYGRRHTYFHTVTIKAIFHALQLDHSTQAHCYKRGRSSTDPVSLKRVLMLIIVRAETVFLGNSFIKRLRT